jgi:hypothetical protein
MREPTGPMPGWESVKAGIELIAWSNLAYCDGSQLVANTDQVAFNRHWPSIDPKFGRWFCWLAFGVGSENIVKGAFGLNRHRILKFGACHPWKRALHLPDEQIGPVSEAINRLATKVRNRDAHEYVANVRDANFPEVYESFVPALNLILACLPADHLRKELHEFSRGSND